MANETPWSTLSTGLDIFAKRFGDILLVNLLLVPIYLLTAFGIGAFTMPILSVLVSLLVSSVFILMAADHKQSLQVYFNKAFDRYGAVLGTIILVALAMIALGLLLAIPIAIFFFSGLTQSPLIIIAGIILTILALIPVVTYSLYWAFVMPVALLKNLSAGNAMGYSKQLVKGRWWRTFGFLLVVGLIIGAVTFFVALFLVVITLFTKNTAAIAIVSTIVNYISSVVSTFYIIVLTRLFLFYDGTGSAKTTTGTRTSASMPAVPSVAKPVAKPAPRAPVRKSSAASATRKKPAKKPSRARK